MTCSPRPPGFGKRSSGNWVASEPASSSTFPVPVGASGRARRPRAREAAKSPHSFTSVSRRRVMSWGACSTTSHFNRRASASSSSSHAIATTGGRGRGSLSMAACVGSPTPSNAIRTTIDRNHVRDIAQTFEVGHHDGREIRHFDCGFERRGHFASRFDDQHNRRHNTSSRTLSKRDARCCCASGHPCRRPPKRRFACRREAAGGQAGSRNYAGWRIACNFNRAGSNVEVENGTERWPIERSRCPHEHEKIIAAFDREREEAHELNRRHHETVTNSRRNDRIVGQDHHDHDR